MKKQIKIRPIHLIFLLFIPFSISCSNSINAAEGQVLKPEHPPGSNEEETIFSEKPQSSSAVDIEPIQEQRTLLDLSAITPNNVEKIKIGKQFLPFYPKISAVSGNLAVIALGDLESVIVYDVKTTSELMEIKTQLPDCQYGRDAYLSLDFSGNFLTITTLSGIEVWQVGGGRVYQSAYKHGNELDRFTCGSDIPQIALSPQGKFLAESGLGVDGEKYSDYFQVVDIQKNEVVYSWDGREEMPHGHLQSDPYLGFSSDGEVLQTFNPKNYIIGRHDISRAYQFWSTKNWGLLERNSDLVTGSVEPGSLFYAISDDDTVKIYNKTTNEEPIEIASDGCTIEYPCDVVFSPDAGLLAILKRSGTVTYKRELLITEINVYEMEGGEFIKSIPVLIRNKNAIRLGNNGEIISIPIRKETMSTWWTNTSYFDGFFIPGKDMIGFIPQVSNLFIDVHPYSGTCVLDLEQNSYECIEGVIQPDGTAININQIKDSFIFIQNGKNIAQVKYPAGIGQDDWQVRFRAYNQQSGVGYFCMDRNLREETCVIMDFSHNEILHEQIDLFGFIFSFDHELSAFINREKKELNIFYETTGRLKQMRSYQAIAYPLQPAISKNGENALYFVQDVENKDLYLEEISLLDAIVIKRFSQDFFSEIIPTTISVNGNTDLLVIGDTNGTLYFFDLAASELKYSVPVSDSKIVAAIFSEDDTQLIVMDGRGVIKGMQVETEKNR